MNGESIKEKFRGLGLTWLSKDEAQAELDRLLENYEEPKSILSELETAQWHYMDLVGVTWSGLFDESVLDIERKENPDLVKVSDGLPIFEDDRCAVFMSTKHGLPLQICAVYVCSHTW
ncbi:TPA: hypothetical protein ACGGNU_002957 [Escherichia coli]|nr:hypothetical protein [Salmonella enterica subsp. enterica serovar Kentucky]